MHFVSQLLFALFFSIGIYLFSKRVRAIRRNVLLGKKDGSRMNEPWRRFKQMALFALGQKKMFKRPIPALLHLLIYVGFVLINIELIEIVADGLLGKHRVLAPLIGSAYVYFIGFFEILALGVILSSVSFLWRRNVARVPRFHKKEMKGWPSLDANLILFIEIALVGSFLLMNAADFHLQSVGHAGYVSTGPFVVSGHLSPIFSGLSHTGIVAIERSLWWFHIIGILFFLNYVTYSKHLHIILAFPNTFFGDISPVLGKMSNMPEVQAEVALMLDPDGTFSTEAPPPPERFGARDVVDLSWKNVLDAYSCTECGRCTAVCPANKTGKLLSPRKIMMDTRDRAEELGKVIERNGPEHPDGKQLLGNYISQEELLACTTCNACVEECPVNINPLDIIIQMRRHLIMDQAQAPAEWNSMFSNVENNMAPWAFPASDRFAWADKINTTNRANTI